MAPMAVDDQVVYDDPAQYLSASISSLSSQRAQTSWIAKSYRHATQLFLTRRLCEAYDAIAPLIEPSPSDQEDLRASHASAHSIRDSPIDAQVAAAPVAASSKGTRVKVWSFYLTLLDAIIQLGPEEGQLALGGPRWNALSTQVRHGTVWDRVVQLGYNGVEGTVDGEVIANLATLLLSHMSSQKFNQQKLESFLAASAMPVFDFSAHMPASELDQGRQDVQRTGSRDGTGTPRDLNTRLKILELYTLHVLPMNQEWEYARDFISMSEVLDDERREAFQHALQSLQEEQSHEALRQRGLERKKVEEAEHERARQEQERRTQASRLEQHNQRQMHATPSSTQQQRGQSRPRASTTGSSVSSQHKKTPRSNAKPLEPPRYNRTSPPQPPPPPPPQTLYHRAASVLAVIRTSLISTRLSTSRLSVPFLRLLLFLLAFVVALSRENIRESMKRMLRTAWVKVRETVGMGVRVSYI